jgi:hypothetical protein
MSYASFWTIYTEMGIVCASMFEPATPIKSITTTAESVRHLDKEWMRASWRSEASWPFVSPVTTQGLSQSKLRTDRQASRRGEARSGNRYHLLDKNLATCDVAARIITIPLLSLVPQGVYGVMSFAGMQRTCEICDITIWQQVIVVALKLRRPHG